MGPRQPGRLSQTGQYEGNTDSRLLQWGRDHQAADDRTALSKRQPFFHSFNGAATTRPRMTTRSACWTVWPVGLQWGRDHQAADDLNERGVYHTQYILASMGPRPP